MYQGYLENRNSVGSIFGLNECEGVEYFTGDSNNYSAGDCILSSSDNTDNCPNDVYHVAFYPTRSSVTSMRNAPIKLYRSTAVETSNRYFVGPALPQTINNEECSAQSTNHNLNIEQTHTE